MALKENIPLFRAKKIIRAFSQFWKAIFRKQIRYRSYTSDQAGYDASVFGVRSKKRSLKTADVDVIPIPIGYVP
ncbi:hypothetical protein MUP05_08355 [Candidatus Bathyarchaeota archaeon]|nr:hypothetical protein [Candidatus Bathyarchaeota archaeon]